MLSNEIKAFLLESYFRNGNKLENGEWQYSYVACYEEFQENYPAEAADHSYDDVYQVVRKTVVLFREKGSVERKTGSGRPKKRTAEVLDNAREIIEATPSTSIRRLGQQLNLSFGTTQLILKKDLQMYPYKLQVYHKILPRDFQPRINYCNWFVDNLNNDEVLDITFFSDEAWFHLDGYVNSQNMRFWSSENPHQFVETPLHPVKLGLWVAISRRRIVPIFFFMKTLMQTFTLIKFLHHSLINWMMRSYKMDFSSKTMPRLIQQTKL